MELYGSKIQLHIYAYETQNRHIPSDLHSINNYSIYTSNSLLKTSGESLGYRREGSYIHGILIIKTK